MLTGANQPVHRCGKKQKVCSCTRTCTVSPGQQSRQHQCVKVMTSVTLKRPSGKWQTNYWSCLIQKLFSLFVSVGLICHEASSLLEESWSTLATFQRLPFPNKFLPLIQSEREHCSSTTHTGCRWIGKGERKVGVQVPRQPATPTALTLSRLAWAAYYRPESNAAFKWCS